MPDIWVNCSHCGHVFSNPGELAGQSIACPTCGKQVVVIASGVRSEGSAKLQIKHDSVGAGGKRCSSCGATMASESVICIQCGYDTRTGSQYLDNPQKSRMLQWVLWGFGLIILVGLAKTFVFSGGTGEGQEATAPSAPPAPVAVAPIAPTATGETAAVQAVAGVQTSLSPAAADVTNKSPIDVAKLEVEYRATLNEQMGTTYPLYAPGDAVVLRRVNGLVHRGTLSEMKPDSVVVVAGGQTNEISLKVLDRASRLKCDPVFRVQVVDFHVQKKVKELADF